jgi:hypothetical protein
LDERLDEKSDRVASGPDDLDGPLVAGGAQIDIVNLKNTIARLQLASFTSGAVRENVLDENTGDG